jgi:hypothetical protein
MPVLTNSQYGAIIFQTNLFNDVQDITDHFLAEYKTNIDDNPRFVEKLKELINTIKQKIDELREGLIAKAEKSGYLNPDGSPKERSDYNRFGFSTNNLGFGLIKFPGGEYINKDKVIEVENAFKQFEEQLKETTELGTDKGELLPEYDFGTDARKIAWLSELGVLELILKKCREGETFVWRRAANIIHSFTDINSETLRKSLQAIYQNNPANSKNNPLSNPNNKIFVEEMRTKFKLDKGS